MSCLIIRILKQIESDKRLIGLIIAAPILLLSLIYLLLGDSGYQPKIAVKGLPPQLVTALEKQDCSLITTDKEADTLLRDKDADGVLSMINSSIHIKILENDAVKTGLVTAAVKNALTEYMPAGSMTTEFIYGTETQSMFDTMGYIMLGILSFFFVFIIAGISFVRERTGGTLERFILSPIKRWQIVAGYTIAFGILSAVQSLIVLIYSEFVLNMNIGGKFVEAACVMLCLALCAVSLGTLVSIFSNNEFQIVQFIPIAVIPQIFFSGLIPLDTIPMGLGKIAYAMPVYYACTALKKLIIYHQGFGDISSYLFVLLGITLVLSAINTLALRRYRKI